MGRRKRRATSTKTSRYAHTPPIPAPLFCVPAGCRKESIGDDRLSKSKQDDEEGSGEEAEDADADVGEEGAEGEAEEVRIHPAYSL